MISVQNLSKRYGNVLAIDDVSFSAEKGQVVAFLGPNGAGKTTTMRILTCFMPASSGTASIAGFDIFDSPMEVKRRIGYLPETPPLYPEMTVVEYLSFVAKIKGMPSHLRRSGLSSALEKCSLGDVSHRLIANLSKGYRQRVGLAQALIHNPDVLILDEPTVGLDPRQIIEIRELIQDLAGEHTIVLSTHILPEATAVCQKVVIISKGRIVAVDSKDDLAARVRKSERIQIRVRRGGPKTIEVMKTISGILHVEAQTADGFDGSPFMVEAALGKDIREALAHALVSGGFGLLEMKPLRLSLEDVFLELTTEENLADDADSENNDDAPNTSTEESA